MKEDFSDIVAHIRDRRSHSARTYTLQEIAAGNLPDNLTNKNTLDREKKFHEALNKWYESTAED